VLQEQEVEDLLFSRVHGEAAGGRANRILRKT
jgi:hypothetical protein